MNYKLLLSISQSALFLEVIYLRIKYKREQDTLEAVKISGIINADDMQQGFIIMLGEVGYFISYVIGYRLQYKKVVDNLLRKSKRGEKNKTAGVGVLPTPKVIRLTKRRLKVCLQVDQHQVQ